MMVGACLAVGTIWTELEGCQLEGPQENGGKMYKKNGSNVRPCFLHTTEAFVRVRNALQLFKKMSLFCVYYRVLHVWCFALHAWWSTMCVPDACRGQRGHWVLWNWH